jgi:hypothetical protein
MERNKHSVKAGYMRGQFWTPIDNLGSVTVYGGPPMDDAAADMACAEYGDTELWHGHA